MTTDTVRLISLFFGITSISLIVYFAILGRTFLEGALLGISIMASIVNFYYGFKK